MTEEICAVLQWHTLELNQTPLLSHAYKRVICMGEKTCYHYTSMPIRIIFNIETDVK